MVQVRRRCSRACNDSARSNALGDLLRRSAARHGAKTALIDGDRTFSYADFGILKRDLRTRFGDR
jgi:non-ribosomal peptide synthetase component E (peptide arylation enzyme)